MLRFDGDRSCSTSISTRILSVLLLTTCTCTVALCTAPTPADDVQLSHIPAVDRAPSGHLLREAKRWQRASRPRDVLRCGRASQMIDAKEDASQAARTAGGAASTAEGAERQNAKRRLSFPQDGRNKKTGIRPRSHSADQATSPRARARRAASSPSNALSTASTVEFQGQSNATKGCCAPATRVRYGMLGEEQRFCRTHRLAAHHNLNNHKYLKCQHAGCTRLGIFGSNTYAHHNHTYAANASAAASKRRHTPLLYCKLHKHPADVDLRNRRCWVFGCSRRALYAVSGTDSSLQAVSGRGQGAHACLLHRKEEEELVGARARVCSVSNCSKVATFGGNSDFAAAGMGVSSRQLRCSRHREPGDVDVRNPRCQAEMRGWQVSKEFALSEPARFPCAKRASFGAKNEGIKRFCAAHKRPDDVNLNNKKTCGASACVTYPSFCDPSTRKAEYCARHRPAGFVHMSSLPPRVQSVDEATNGWVPDHLWYSPEPTEHLRNT